MIYLYIAAGGAAGALARFGVAVWAVSVGGPAFPWATLVVNAAGSLLLGMLMEAFPVTGAGPEIRALLAVGFCGSLTTFSTFGYEVVLLWQAGASSTAAAYIVASLVLGITGVLGGLWVGGLMAV